MKFYSEYQEDKFVAHNLALPAHGFYVDIGAMRPDQFSNTAFLRDKGWHGIAVDGNHGCIERWKSVPNCRFLNAIVSSQKSHVSFKRDRERSSIARGVPALAYPEDGLELVSSETTTLGEILKDVERVDFLSLDIEGEEFAALTGFDFGRFRPHVIVSEYSTMQPDGSIVSDFRAADLLKENGYKEVYRTVANIIYVPA